MTHSAFLTMALGQILIQTGVLSEDHLEMALRKQRDRSGRTGTMLVEEGYVGLLNLEHALARQYGVPPVYDAELENIDPQCRNLLPLEVMEKYEMLPFRKLKDEIWVAMTNPRNQAAIETLLDAVSYRLRVFSISEIRFQYYLFRHFPRQSESRIRNIFFNYLKEKCRTKLHEESGLNSLEQDTHTMGLALLRKELFGRNHSHEPRPMQYLDPALLGNVSEAELEAARVEEELYFPKLNPEQNPFAVSAEKFAKKEKEQADFEPEFAGWEEFEK